MKKHRLFSDSVRSPFYVRKFVSLQVLTVILGDYKDEKKT